MRVGVIGPDEVDDFAWLIARGFRQLNCDVVEFGSAFGSPWSRGRRLEAIRRTAFREERVAEFGTRALLRKIESAELDLIVTVESLPPILVQHLAALGIRTALWFPDHISNLGSLWMFRAPYTALFFKEPVLVRTLSRTYGYPVHYLAECCDPSLHRPEHGEQVASIAVVGNMYATRVHLLNKLHADGIPLTLYGGVSSDFLKGTPLDALHTKKYLRGTEKAQVFRNSTAVLNNMHPGEIEGVNARLFEATGSGAVVVSEFKAELPRLFEIGREVLTFSAYEDLRETLMELLSVGGIAREIGDAASERSHTDHTYEVRLRTLLEVAMR